MCKVLQRELVSGPQETAWVCMDLSQQCDVVDTVEVLSTNQDIEHEGGATI